VPTAMPMAGG